MRYTVRYNVRKSLTKDLPIHKFLVAKGTDLILDTFFPESDNWFVELLSGWWTWATFEVYKNGTPIKNRID